MGFGLNVARRWLCSWSADGSVRTAGRNVGHQSWAIKVGSRVVGPMMAEHTAKAAISNEFGQSRGPQTEDMGRVLKQRINDGVQRVLSFYPRR